MALKVSLLFCLFSIMIACGKKGDRIDRSPVFLVGQSVSGFERNYGTVDKNLVSNIQRMHLLKDMDGDGILDKNDSDIDSDGVPNDCDRDPFDPLMGTKDSDHDGVPDYCDFNPRSDIGKDTKLADFQFELFKEKKILLINDDLSMEDEDLSFFKRLIANIQNKASLPNKYLATITLTSQLVPGEYGLYDSQWANIRFFKNGDWHEEFPNILMWQWCLTHEFHHYVEHGNPSYFKNFLIKYTEKKKNNELDFFTIHSKVNPNEYFAEFETYLFFNELVPVSVSKNLST